VVASSSGRVQSMTRLRSRIGTPAVDVYGTVGLRPHAGHCDVVLIGDVTHNLLQNVLEGDEAHDFSIFVHDQGEGCLAPAEGFELLRQWPGFRNKPGRPGDLFDGDLGKIPIPLPGSRGAGPWRAGCQ